MTAFMTILSTAAQSDTLMNATLKTRGDLAESVLVLGKGMLGIFLFMLLFYLLIYGLEKIFTVKTKHEA